MSSVGTHKRDFTLSPYNPEWPRIFDQEAALLKEALGEHILATEHNGSTSIPGMHAKPIIDILIAVPSLPDALNLVPIFESLGYMHRSDDIIPERLFLAKESAPQIRTHHLSITEHASTFWHNQLAFRDYLRTHPEHHPEYIALKNTIADKYNKTGTFDLDAKTPFVQKILKLAAKP